MTQSSLIQSFPLVLEVPDTLHSRDLYRFQNACCVVFNLATVGLGSGFLGSSKSITVHSFGKSLNACSVPGTLLGVEETAVNKTDKNACPGDAPVPVQRDDNKQKEHMTGHIGR